MKKSTRVLSFMLAMLMLFSAFSVLASAKEVEVAQTSATVTSDGSARLYFNMKAVSWWTAGNSGDGNFAYFFNNSTGKNAWSAHAVKYSGDTYYVVIPNGSWSGVILTRNNTSTAPSWENKWNQTGDITMSSTSNYLSKFSEGSTSATWGTAIKPASTAAVTADATTVELGDTVNLTAALTSNADINTIASVAYTATTGTVADGVYTPSALGVDTVTATVTYYPNAYSTLTSTATATVEITVVEPAGETDTEATEPEATEPEATEPEATEPEATEPEATEPEATELEPTEEPTEAPISKTAYCVNSMSWDAMSAYAWTDGGEAMTWPGTAMTKTEDKVNGFDVYEITVDVDYQSIIFNNNDNGKQTDDLTFEDGKYYDLKSGEWYASLDEVPGVDSLATDRYLVGSFNGWNTLSHEFKLDAEGSKTGYISLDLEANTTYEFKVVREGAWTSNTTPITDTVEGLTFSSSVADNAKITTTVAGTYVFSFGIDNSQLSVTYPEIPTEPETQPEETQPEETQPEETQPEETQPEATEPEIIAPAGYYLVGTLNGTDKWFVDADSADRMLTENAASAGEYMIDYTFADGDEIKVVYFDGTAIAKWYKDQADNYKIDETKAGEGTLYFRAEGNADWSYYYFTVIPEVVPVEPTEEPTEPEATGDQPATEPEETQPEATQPEEEAEYMTIYFQNNWLWSEVSLYYWGSTAAENPAWPGVAMELYKNDGNYDIYSVEVPTDITGLIINGKKDDGTGTIDKTPDIKDGWYDGICYYMRWDNGNAFGSEDISVILPSLFPTEPQPTEPIEKITKVEGVHQSDSDYSSVEISWDAAENVAYYWVFINGLCYDKTTETTFTIPNRKMNTEYEVYVLASFADKTMTSVVDADVITAATDGYDVTSGSVTATTNSIKFEWDNTDVTKTWIYYVEGDAEPVIYDSTTAGEYTLTGLDSKTLYSYKLVHLVNGTLVDGDFGYQYTETDEGLVVDVAYTDDTGYTVEWNEYEGTYKYWVFVETAEKTYIYVTTDTKFVVSGVDYVDCTIRVQGHNNNGMVYYYAEDFIAI